MEDSKDSLERRCPRLGSIVSFLYCKTGGANEQPCWKIIDCWWEYFDVAAYLNKNMPAAVVRKIIDARPKPKVESLLDLINKAKKNLAQQKKSDRVK